MPAMLEDPTAPAIYRTSGAPPYPTPLTSEIPPTIALRQVTLRDRITIASLVPFSSPASIPTRLLSYLCQQLNLEIEKGDTYPMISPMAESTFGTYWFQNFGAVMILGAIGEHNYIEEVWRMEKQGVKWEECALGSFYVKPNYPGRSSHVCNGGFLVTEAARNRGVGRLMGEGYLEWAPRLGYTYSVFNLVYETNVASCRIWDALGFKRIGRVKACGNLRSHPNALVDAIIYGRDLGPEGEDYVSEERFDKIRFYLKHGKYPNGADRAEKSRLRSAATHYKLLPAEEGREGEEDAERLMLRDKEVVSDPQRQYEIARKVHVSGQHGGINKTTATIAEKYHWVRIKETVSLVIKNCAECKDTTAKLPTTPGRSNVSNGNGNGNDFTPSVSIQPGGQAMSTGNNHTTLHFQPSGPTSADSAYDQLVDFAQHNPHTVNQSSAIGGPGSTPLGSSNGNSGASRAPMAHMGTPNIASGALSQYAGIPLDPQIMSAHAHHHHQQHHQVQHHQQPHNAFSQMHGDGPSPSPSQQTTHASNNNTTHHPQRPHEQQQAAFFLPQQPQHHHHVHNPTQVRLPSSSHSPYPHSPQPLLHGHAHPPPDQQQDPHKQPDNVPYGHPHHHPQHHHHLAAYDSRASVPLADVGSLHTGGGDLGEGVDAPFDVVMTDDSSGGHGLVVEPVSSDQGQGQDHSDGSGGAGGDDTRLATEQHIKAGDDPLSSR